MFCDSGAKPNLLKANAINLDYHEVNQKETLKLLGITSEPVFTMGTVDLNIEGSKTKFNLIPESFPIETNGLLGRNFFRENGAVINFKNNSLDFKGKEILFIKGATVNLPARSTTMAYVRIENKIEEGYLRELKIKKGIYAGKGVVRNKEGKACIPFFNTTEEDICIIIPTVRLEEYDEIENPEALTNP